MLVPDRGFVNGLVESFHPSSKLLLDHIQERAYDIYTYIGRHME